MTLRLEPGPTGKPRPNLDGIYIRIGGDKGLETILKDFYARMAGDILIGYFFDGKDANEIAMKQKGFLLRAMGVLKSYSGPPPAEAHTKLPEILPGHFDRRLRILETTLKDHRVEPEDIRSWVAFEDAFRPGIVTEAKPST